MSPRLRAPTHRPAPHPTLAQYSGLMMMGNESLRKLLKVDGSALVLTPDGSYKSAHAEGMLEMKRNALQVTPPPPPPPRNSSAQFGGARGG